MAEKDVAETGGPRATPAAGASGVATARVDAVLLGTDDCDAGHWKLRAKGGVRDLFFHTLPRMCLVFSPP